MRSIPTLDELAEIIPDDVSAMKYLDERGIFYKVLDCMHCGKAMRRVFEDGVFRCSTKTCKQGRVSIRKHTFFAKNNLSPKRILRLAHLWLSGATHSTAVILTGHSSTTVCAFYEYFRQLVAQSLQEEDQVIGGSDVIIEIDETKLGKRKFNRGHRVEGVWVVVGVERGANGKVFVVPVERRDSETLIQIIAAHVAPGSIINTDRWKGYSGLSTELGLRHITVNHSETFRDPITGACTNTVEGINSALKRKIPVRNRVKDGITGHIAEYIWRRKNEFTLWESFIQALADIHYD
jgi:transposase-like protein